MCAKSRFQDSAIRARAKQDVVARLERVYAGDGARISIATAPESTLMGHTLADAAVAAGRTPSVHDVAETVLDLVTGYPEQTSIYCVFHAISEQDLRLILQYPATMIASDGWSIVFGEGHHQPGAFIAGPAMNP